MDVGPMIEALDEQGRLLVGAARAAGTSAPVPSCPGWTVADLLRHIGEVHRWASFIVATAATDDPDSSTVVGPIPVDAGLAEWVTDGHGALVETLRAAPPDLACWQFLRAPSPLAFWARRQLHETAVHRMDAELAAGQAISPVAADVAEDGIDEMLAGFLPRRSSRLRSQRQRSFQVAPTDSTLRWWVGISGEQPVTVREERAADVVFSALVGELYPALWNRADLDGDADLVALWQDGVTVQWR
jgi:uncharacterized protein (TIGR03083 family)